MNIAMFYSLAGISLFILGLHSLITHSHLLRKVLALNIMGSGVFLVLVSLGRRAGEHTDPVPQAMVITGIVVAVAATALALALIVRLNVLTGHCELNDNHDNTPHD